MHGLFGSYCSFPPTPAGTIRRLDRTHNRLTSGEHTYVLDNDALLTREPFEFLHRLDLLQLEPHQSCRARNVGVSSLAGKVVAIGDSEKLERGLIDADDLRSELSFHKTLRCEFGE